MAAKPEEQGPAPAAAVATATVGATSPPRRRSLTIGFSIVAGLVLLLLVVIFRPIVRPLLWAAAFATLVYPAHRRLVDLVGGRVTLAATLSTGLWVAVVAVPSIALLNQLIGEARNLWPQLTGQLGTDAFTRGVAWVEASPLARSVHLALEVPMDAGAAGLEDKLRAQLEALGSAIVAQVRDLTLSAPGALVNAGVTIVILFFFLRQGPRWSQRLRDALPIDRADAEALLDTAQRTVGAVFRGVLLTAAAQAGLATLGYVVVAAPVPLLLGAATFFTAMLPFVGAAAVWLPTAIGLYLSGAHREAIVLAVWGTAVVSLVDNFLRPYLIGRESSLPLLWLFLAILGGIQRFGLLGILLGPAALALFIACYRMYMQQRARERTAM